MAFKINRIIAKEQHTIIQLSQGDAIDDRYTKREFDK